MTVAPLGAETSMDLDCTLKGQHMTGNQSAPNWMISSHLNMFHLFFSFFFCCIMKKYERASIFLANIDSGYISTLCGILNNIIS